MKSRFLLKLVSLLIGLFAWIYVNIMIPPLSRRTITTHVTYRNPPQQVIISPENPTIAVELEGSRRDFIFSGEKFVNASLDLYNVRPGKVTIPIEVTPAPGLSVISIYPAQIALEIQPLTTKQFVVEPRITGTPADGFLAEPRILPSVVTLTGPQENIDEIDQCYLDIDLTNIRNSLSEQRVVKFTPAQSAMGVDINPSLVTLNVAVKQGYPSKTLPLSEPSFVNTLPPGKILASFDFFPKEISLSGPQRFLDQMSFVNLEPIDLALLATGTTMPLALKLPHKQIHLTYSSIEPYISISIQEKKIQKAFYPVRFKVVANPEYNLDIADTSFTVILEGLPSELEKITNDELATELNIEHLQPGTHMAALPIPEGIPEQLSLSEIIPPSIELIISIPKQPKFTPPVVEEDSTPPPNNSN